MEFLKSAPPLAVLVIVVWIFLRHLKDRDEQFAAVVRQINAENTQARTETNRVIQINSEVVSKNNETRGEMMEVIRELNVKIKNI